MAKAPAPPGPLLFRELRCPSLPNEQGPWGVYVKSTHLEWKEGPHGKAGIVCQECHMPPAAGRSARMGSELPDMRQHLFHGAHDPGTLAGVIEVRIHPDLREAEPGETVKLTAVYVNAKAGHKIARLVPYAPPKRRISPPGFLKDKIWIADDFDAPLPAEVVDEFYR